MKTLTSALNKGCQLQTPATLPERKQPPGTNSLGGWVGPRASLDAVEQKTFLSLPEIKLRPSKTSGVMTAARHLPPS
jgi:hypothetical protein